MSHGTMSFEAKRFDALVPGELYDLLQLRSEVFVVEQHCVFQDLDGHDFDAWHLLGRIDARLEAYARWYPVPEGIHLGRIVTRQRVRGQGYGHRLVREALERIGPRPVVIQAQARLEGYYAALGWATTGPAFLLDGIPHVPMRR